MSSGDHACVVTAVTELRPKNGSSSTVMVATEGGLAAISLDLITLEEKVAHYEAMVSPQHNRYGWTAQVPLARHGDRDSYVPTDGDNDGSNTAYYMASQIFRYRVTESAEALKRSWRAFDAMEFLHNVTRPFAKDGKPVSSSPFVPFYSMLLYFTRSALQLSGFYCSYRGQVWGSTPGPKRWRLPCRWERNLREVSEQHLLGLLPARRLMHGVQMLRLGEQH